MAVSVSLKTLPLPSPRAAAAAGRLRAADAPRPPRRHLPAAVAHALGAVDRGRPDAYGEAAARVHRRHRGDALGRLRDQRLRGPQHRPAREAHAAAAARRAAGVALRGAGAVRAAGAARAVAGHAARPEDRVLLVRRRSADRELSVREAVLPAAAVLARGGLRLGGADGVRRDAGRPCRASAGCCSSSRCCGPASTTRSTPWSIATTT